MMAWISILRSSSTVLRTSVTSAFDSDLTGALSMTRIFLDLKPARVSSMRGGAGRTQVELVVLILQLNHSLLGEKGEDRLEHLSVHARARLDVVVGETVAARVELQEDTGLECGCDEKVLLRRVERAELVPRRLPEPGELATAARTSAQLECTAETAPVLAGVESLKSLVYLDELDRELEARARLRQRPGRRAKNKNVEVDCERSAQLDARTHSPPSLASLSATFSLNCMFMSLHSAMSWNMRVNLLVYSKPQASLSLVIMLDSASSDADESLMRRLASILE